MPQSLAITHKELMLATAAREPFDRAGWIYELKLDGFRCLAVKEADSVRMLSRRGNSLEPCFPEIVRCACAVPPIGNGYVGVSASAVGSGDLTAPATCSSDMRLRPPKRRAGLHLCAVVKVHFF